MIECSQRFQLVGILHDSSEIIQHGIEGIRFPIFELVHKNADIEDVRHRFSFVLVHRGKHDSCTFTMRVYVYVLAPH